MNALVMSSTGLKEAKFIIVGTVAGFLLIVVGVLIISKKQKQENKEERSTRATSGYVNANKSHCEASSF